MVVRLAPIPCIGILLHLDAVGNDRIVGDHDRLRPAGGSAGEEQERELRLALARLQPRLYISLRLQEALLDEVADGDVVVAGDTVEEDDAVVADACLTRGFEPDLQGVGVQEEEGGLGGLNLVDELIGGVRGVRAAVPERLGMRRLGKDKETYVTMPPTRCVPLVLQTVSDTRRVLRGGCTVPDDDGVVCGGDELRVDGVKRKSTHRRGLDQRHKLRGGSV